MVVFLPAFTNAKESVEKAVGRKKDDPKDAWIRYYLEELKKSSSAQQVTVGALSGWTSGFIAAKFGRTAATAVGGTVLLLHVSYQIRRRSMTHSRSPSQFAQHYGYIQVDWKRLKRDVDSAKRDVTKKVEKELPDALAQLQTFLVENVLLAGGFAGGFLLGLASG